MLTTTDRVFRISALFIVTLVTIVAQQFGFSQRLPLGGRPGFGFAFILYGSAGILPALLRGTDTLVCEPLAALFGGGLGFTGR